MKKLKYVKLFENFQLNESILDKFKSAVGLELKTPKEFDTEKIDNLTLTDEQKDVKNKIIMAINYLKENAKNDYKLPVVDFKAIKLVNNGLVIETEYKQYYKEYTKEIVDYHKVQIFRYFENYLSKKDLKVDIEVKCERKELFDKIKANFSKSLDGDNTDSNAIHFKGISPVEREKRDSHLASLGMIEPEEKKGTKIDNYEAAIKSAKFGELPVITTITITKK